MFKREYKAIKQYNFETSYTVIRKSTMWKFVWYQEIWEWADMFGKRIPVITSKYQADLIIHCIRRKYGCTYQWRQLCVRNKYINPWTKKNNSQ